MTRYIYGLVDPTTDRIGYVGKSSAPQTRLASHWQSKDKGTSPKHLWLQRLAIPPRLVILQQIPDDTAWEDIEGRWIQHGLENGWPLTNVAGTNGTRSDDLPDEPLDTPNVTAPVVSQTAGVVAVQVIHHEPPFWTLALWSIFMPWRFISLWRRYSPRQAAFLEGVISLTIITAFVAVALVWMKGV